MQIKRRQRNENTYRLALEAGISPLLAHIVACRLTDCPEDIHRIIRPALKYIDHPELLVDAVKAAERIADAIRQQQRIGILTDYDVDGITSHAIVYRALSEYFNFPRDHIDSLIGHRIQDGYGISPHLTERIIAQPVRPDVIITADCGSSDEAQIARLKGVGIDVIVTDHHALPLAGPPVSAYAVVNPTRSDCPYPDATIAGCMTAWLLMSLVRNQLIAQGELPADTPKLSRELDYVSLGTAADCVSIGTAINRAVLNTGLKQLNRLGRPCWQAMQTLLGNHNNPFTVEDLSFQIGPRINARSRLADPYAALHYLLAQTHHEAVHYLKMLDVDNQDRKRIERNMVEDAKREAEQQVILGKSALVVYLEEGHSGVQGIVASRLVEAFGRPAIVLCPASEPTHITGSARGIAGLHLRDTLQQVADSHPELFVKFGGHRGAAGLTILRTGLGEFCKAFEQAVSKHLRDQELTPVIWTDGALEEMRISLETVAELEQLQPYGREFETPIFEGVFTVKSVRVVGNEPIHLALDLGTSNTIHKGIWFRALAQPGDPPPVAPGDRVECAYRLSVNTFRGVRQLKLMVEYANRLCNN
jgi:single-stranded-DNA-specific exonuclease